MIFSCYLTSEIIIYLPPLGGPSRFIFPFSLSDANCFSTAFTEIPSCLLISATEISGLFFKSLKIIIELFSFLLNFSPNLFQFVRCNEYAHIYS